MSKARRIIQYTMAGEEVGFYGSIKEAQAAYGITHISSVCRKKRVTDGGYRWGYEGEGLPEVSPTSLKKSLALGKRREESSKETGEYTDLTGLMSAQEGPNLLQ